MNTTLRVRQKLSTKNHVTTTVTRMMYGQEAKLDDPWKLLAGAVILQQLIDDYHWLGYSYYKDRMTEADYRFYAAIAGINADYITLLQNAIENRTEWRQRDACAYMTAGL